MNEYKIKSDISIYLKHKCLVWTLIPVCSPEFSLYSIFCMLIDLSCSLKIKCEFIKHWKKYLGYVEINTLPF